MRIALLTTAALAAAVAVPASSKPTPAAALKLERVVMLMRHGIRPPTKAQPVPVKYGADKWPSWGVAPGLLTERGAAGVRLLGGGDRALYAQRGLVGAGCPAPGAVVLKASGKPRAIDTAKNWATAFMPGCTATVDHPTEDGPDPIFHGLDDEPASFDGAKALTEARAALPKGGIAEEARRHRPLLVLLARAMGCAAPACPLLTEPTELIGSAHDRPELEGPIDVGSTASQSFLLEYLEGMPMKDVAWGRASRADIERMLEFHPTKFRYSNRPDYVARNAAAPLAKEMLAALDSPAKLTLLAGHDTNIADTGGFFRLHWKVPQYPVDDVPPGGALGFELLRDAKGVRFVRAFFRAQTMDQLRNQQPLGAAGAYRQYLPIPGCGNSIAARACSWSGFQALVRSRLPS